MPQVWGYKADGSAHIFDDVLPPGWSDTPDVIEDEGMRTAEALTAASRDPVNDDAPVEDAPKRRGRPPKVADPAPEVGSEA